jgi:hypothetical protein
MGVSFDTSLTVRAASFQTPLTLPDIVITMTLLLFVSNINGDCTSLALLKHLLSLS